MEAGLVPDHVQELAYREWYLLPSEEEQPELPRGPCLKKDAVPGPRPTPPANAPRAPHAPSKSA